MKINSQVEDISKQDLLTEIASLRKENLEQKITLARVDEAISNVRGVALTKELSKAYIAFDETDPSGWLSNQMKAVHLQALYTALQTAEGAGANNAVLDAIQAQIVHAEKHYWTLSL